MCSVGCGVYGFCCGCQRNDRYDSTIPDRESSVGDCDFADTFTGSSIYYSMSLDIADDSSGVCANVSDLSCVVGVKFVFEDTALAGLNINPTVLDLTSGTSADGTYSVSFFIPESIPDGKSKVLVQLTDVAGNSTSADYATFDIVIADEYVNEDVKNVVHRFYSTNYQSHFFTLSPQEANHLILNDVNWSYEGQAYEARLEDDTDVSPVYRFYSSVYNSHFYTISEPEKISLETSDPNWAYEGIAYYTQTIATSGNLPLYRFYSESFRSHFYTSSEVEKKNLEENDPNWNYEGVAWYVND